jgi:hypothetical protein
MNYSCFAVYQCSRLAVLMAAEKQYCWSVLVLLLQLQLLLLLLTAVTYYIIDGYLHEDE